MNRNPCAISSKEINNNCVLISLSIIGGQMNLYFSGIDTINFKEFEQKKINEIMFSVDGDKHEKNHEWVEKFVRGKSCYMIICKQCKTSGKVLMNISTELGDEITKKISERIGNI